MRCRRKPAEGAVCPRAVGAAESARLRRTHPRVDVGAKEEIYAVLRRLAGEGVAIILISSELNEVLALSHRIAVVRHGRVSKVMDNLGLDEHALLIEATNAVPGNSVPGRATS